MGHPNQYFSSPVRLSESLTRTLSASTYQRPAPDCSVLRRAQSGYLRGTASLSTGRQSASDRRHRRVTPVPVVHRRASALDYERLGLLG